MRSSTACVASTGEAAPLRYSASSSVAVHWVRSVVTPSSWQGRHPVLSFRFGPIGPVPKDRSWLQSDGTWTSTPGARHAPAVGDRPPRPVPGGRHRRAGRRPAAHRRLRASAVRRRRHPVRRDDGLAGGPAPEHRRRRGAHRQRRVGPAAGPRRRPPPRWLRRSDARARGGHRRARRRLRGAVLRPPDAAHGAPAGIARALRRGDGGPRRRRQPARAVRVLGAHLGHVVPPHRPRSRGSQGQGRRPAGPPGHRCGCPGDARRLHRPRPDRRDVPAQRHPRRPARRRRGDGRHRADPARRLHQVGADAVPRLAARGDGRPHAGERLPALGDDGQGRGVPRRPPRPGVRRPRPVAPGGRHGRRRDDDRRRPAGDAPARPQAAPRLRHDQPARADDRRVRLGHPGGRHRRLRDAAGPRRLQGRRLHGRRDRRPPTRHP